MEILKVIAAKLDKAFLSGGHSKFFTVIDLVFKKDQILSEEDEVALLEWIRAEIKPEWTYICCNRAWKEGPKFKAFLHLYCFDTEQKMYQQLLKEFNVLR
ncbi:MAG: hypothetical protein NTZ49_05220 [Candidatus Parcubacteria bacterium]|nr:hypothetical protein [Candidatus Parcubacteria bacterium]